MFFSCAIDAVIKDIQSLTGVHILDPYFFDPNPSDWGIRLHDRLAKIEFADRKDDWMITVFARSAQEPLSVLPRKQKFIDRDVVDGTVQNYITKFTSCSVELGFVSNSPDFIENFEEYLLLSYDRSKTIVAQNYPLIGGTMDVFLDNLKPKGLNKLDNDKNGSLIILSWSFDLEYPIMLPKEKGKIIKDIKLQTNYSIELL